MHLDLWGIDKLFIATYLILLDSTFSNFLKQFKIVLHLDETSGMTYFNILFKEIYVFIFFISFQTEMNIKQIFCQAGAPILTHRFVHVFELPWT